MKVMKYTTDYLNEVKHSFGVKLYENRTEFKVFAKDIKSIKVLLYNSATTNYSSEYEMKEVQENIFGLAINENLSGKYYTYLINEEKEVSDPYSKATSINSVRSYICEVKDSKGKVLLEKPREIEKCNAIIYELHIKDYTFSESAGAVFRGKFLGLAEENTKYENISTGLDHLCEMGVTHIHLMPVNDFLTVREETQLFYNEENYNWGYDPEHYMSVENSYGIHSEDPLSAMRELKTLIGMIHKKGMGVILDMVFNHTYRGKTSNLALLGANEYYRFNSCGDWSNGSGVGNEVASEKPMARKLIIDSLIYWLEEFKVDGFRFDLMSLIDRQTIEYAMKILREINPNILLYGEPWMALETTLEEEQIIRKGNQCGYALFNDTFRDAIRGDNSGSSRGFVQGKVENSQGVILGLKGSLKNLGGFTNTPEESINYISSHDDLIIYDLLKKSLPNMSEENIEKLNLLAMGIVLTSQGTIFLHEGMEFLRSKQGVSNTYNSSITVNQVDWSLKLKNYHLYKAVRELIELRKEYAHFRLNPSEIEENIVVLESGKGPIVIKIIGRQLDLLIGYNNQGQDYFLDYKEGDKIYKIFNGMERVAEEIDSTKISFRAYSMEIYEIKK